MTNIKSKLSIISSAALLCSLAFTSCKKDDENSGTAQTEFKVTDAAIDDASVNGAFVTIADVKLDGVSLQGFTKTTVDVAAYQNGATKTLGNFNLEGKTYNNVTFVLDYDTDANGNAPGSYILTTNGTKHKLQSAGSNEIVINKSLTLQGNASNSIVADFDLRKIIIRQAGGATDQYDFATNAELQSGIRVVAENKTGIISGTLTDLVSSSDKVVAYAYKKGTFDRATEIQAQGTAAVQFKNAVSSAVVNGNGTYQLHFLENGEYEIHFASYKDTNADGQFELKGTLVVLASNGLDILNLNLGSNATLTANATASGVIN